MTTETPNTSEETQAQNQAETHAPSVLVTDGDTSIGLAVIRTLTKAGFAVIATTRHGAKSATSIKRVGGMVAYTDVTREGEIASLLKMSKAQYIVHTSPQALNVMPFQRLAWQADAQRLQAQSRALSLATKLVPVKRMVVLSMAFLYGDQHGHHVTEETHLQRANDFYKDCIRAENVFLNTDSPSVILRAGYVYGGMGDAVQGMAKALASGKALFEGNGWTGFIYQDDLAQAVLSCLTQDPASNIYNIVDDTPNTLSGFSDALGQSLGVGKPSRVPNFLGIWQQDDLQTAMLAQSHHLDNSKARAELHWQPSYGSVTAGLERTLMMWRASEAPEEATPIPQAQGLVLS